MTVMEFRFVFLLFFDNNGRVLPRYVTILFSNSGGGGMKLRRLVYTTSIGKTVFCERSNVHSSLFRAGRLSISYEL